MTSLLCLVTACAWHITVVYGDIEPPVTAYRDRAQCEHDAAAMSAEDLIDGRGTPILFGCAFGRTGIEKGP